MSFLATVDQARAFLERQQRISLKALRREFGLDAETFADLIEALVQVQAIASLEGEVLVWRGREAVPVNALAIPTRDPHAYTPKHLADKILQSKSALEGEPANKSPSCSPM